MRTLRQLQQGFAAVAALFLLVVLAALGAFMLTFSSAQQRDSAADVQGSRAYWAARAGVAWGLGSVAVSPTCPASPTTLTVDGFSVTVTCSRQTHDEGGSTVAVFTFVATAAGGGSVGGAGYVERSVTATVEL